jgi:hypothetical protein
MSADRRRWGWRLQVPQMGQSRRSSKFIQPSILSLDTTPGSATIVGQPLHLFYRPICLAPLRKLSADAQHDTRTPGEDDVPRLNILSSRRSFLEIIYGGLLNNFPLTGQS